MRVQFEVRPGCNHGAALASTFVQSPEQFPVIARPDNHQLPKGPIGSNAGLAQDPNMPGVAKLHYVRESGGVARDACHTKRT